MRLKRGTDFPPLSLISVSILKSKRKKYRQYMATEKNKEDFLIKEIESWKGFEYAFREEIEFCFTKC